MAEDPNQQYEDFLNSLHAGYDNYADYKDNNDLAFEYGDENLVTANVRRNNANTRKGYAFNDYGDLIDLVGSKKHKDIRMKQAFMSPVAFKHWQQNPQYPQRKKWTCAQMDLDGDGKAEFLVADKKNNIIGVNGYYMANSKYPQRYAYQEGVQRDSKGKRIQKFDDWMNTQTGMKYGLNSLDMTYDEELPKSNLYKMWNKYGDATKKFPKKIRAYKHFTSYLFPLLSNCAKVEMLKGCSALQAEPQIIQNLSECVKYPGHTAVQSARFYTAQCFYAWNVYMMQPILHLAKIQEEIQKEVEIVTQLMKTDKEFATNHEGDDPVKLAVTRIKTRKWFKDIIDEIYTKLLNDTEPLQAFVRATVAKFTTDYMNLTQGNLLFNEDKIRALYKKKLIPENSKINLIYEIDNFNLNNVQQTFNDVSGSSSILDSEEVPSVVSPIAKAQTKTITPQKLPLVFDVDEDDEKSEFDDEDEPKESKEKAPARPPRARSPPNINSKKGKK